MKKKYKTIRELKNQLRNFATLRKPFEGNTLADKIAIINRNWFGDDESKWLDCRGIFDVLSEIQEQVNKDKLLVRASNQISRVLDYLWRIEKRPNSNVKRPRSLAVYQPSEIIASAIDLSEFAVGGKIWKMWQDEERFDKFRSALFDRDFDKAQALLDDGVDINTHFGESGDTIFIDVATRHIIELFDFLLKNGADINATDNYGNTALMCSMQKFSYEDNPTKDRDDTVKALLKAGADPNARNNKNGTALSTAFWWGDTGLMSILIDNGADPNSHFAILDQRNYNYKTEPLSIALSHRCSDDKYFNYVCKLIKEGVVDIEATDEYGDTAFSNVACCLNFSPWTKRYFDFLLENGADVDVPTAFYPPIMEAASHNDIEMINTLLEHGANPNNKGTNKYGLSALHMAIKGRESSLPVVKALVEAGADVNAIDNDGKTPLDLAEEWKHNHVASYLRSVGARR